MANNIKTISDASFEADVLKPTNLYWSISGRNGAVHAK